MELRLQAADRVLDSLTGPEGGPRSLDEILDKTLDEVDPRLLEVAEGDACDNDSAPLPDVPGLGPPAV